MRNAFAAKILDLAQKDSRVVMLSGDIGNRLFVPFQEAFPERFYNCGVAEANMTGIAAGLAMTGFRPFTYTITPFNTIRCLEQIKLDVCYHNNPVVIVGTGSGLSYAGLGATHHSCEDIAMLRSLPGMAVFCPADVWEVEACMELALEHNGPCYIRLGKKGEPDVHKAKPALEYGKFFPVREGKDVCLLSTGNMLMPAVEAAGELASKGCSAAVFSCPNVKPLDTSALLEIFRAFPAVITLEEHSLIGGFGSAVAEWVVDNGPFPAKFGRRGLPDAFIHNFNKQGAIREKSGLQGPQIAEYALGLLAKN